MEPIDKEGKVTVHIGENTVRLQRKKEGGREEERPKPLQVREGFFQKDVKSYHK